MIVLSPQRLVVAEQAILEELARRDFKSFLHFVKLLEPPPGRGLIAFEPWPHLMQVVKALESSRLVVILKSRQVGISWLLAAWALWTMLYHRGAMVLMLSKGQEEAETLLGKARLIYTQLPLGLQMPLRVDNASEIAMKGEGSRILALPATESAGRSETATLVIQDEADYHGHLENNFAAVKPTIDVGGQLVMASTVNKHKAQSLFQEVYRASPDNGFVKLFIPWQARPGRDADWFECIRAAVPQSAEMSPELFMEQEYPGSEEEALAPARSIMAFDVVSLERMRQDMREPIERRGLANIYQKPAVGKRYLAGTDTSHGVGRDDAVTAVMDNATGYVAADILGSNISPDELAYQSAELLKLYYNPIWAIEDNDWGRVTIARALDMLYPALYYQDGLTKAKPGYHTDERSRYILWGELIEAVAAGLITVPSREGQRQFWSVIRNPDKAGRIEAMIGGRDHYPVAVGLAWQMRKEAIGREGGGTVFDMRPKVRQRSIW